MNRIIGKKNIFFKGRLKYKKSCRILCSLFCVALRNSKTLGDDRAFEENTDESSMYPSVTWYTSSRLTWPLIMTSVSRSYIVLFVSVGDNRVTGFHSSQDTRKSVYVLSKSVCKAGTMTYVYECISTSYYLLVLFRFSINISINIFLFRTAIILIWTLCCGTPCIYWTIKNWKIKGARSLKFSILIFLLSSEEEEEEEEE